MGNDLSCNLSEESEPTDHEVHEERTPHACLPPPSPLSCSLLVRDRLRHPNIVLIMGVTFAPAGHRITLDGQGPVSPRRRRELGFEDVGRLRALLHPLPPHHQQLLPRRRPSTPSPCFSIYCFDLGRRSARNSQHIPWMISARPRTLHIYGNSGSQDGKKKMVGDE